MSMKGQSSRLYTLSMALLLLTLMLVAGCGVTTTGLSGAAGNSPEATGTASHPSATQTVPGTSTGPGTPTVAGTGSTATGCPSPTHVVNWPSPPTVIITSAQASKGASLQVGQTLEIALAFGSHWSFEPVAAHGVLVLNTPAGYGDASIKSCVWRFTAEQAGQVTLIYTVAPICLAHMECPQYVGILKIAVDVRQ
jgi:hypothetical protein